MRICLLFVASNIYVECLGSTETTQAGRSYAPRGWYPLYRVIRYLIGKAIKTNREISLGDSNVIELAAMDCHETSNPRCLVTSKVSKVQQNTSSGFP